MRTLLHVPRCDTKQESAPLQGTVFPRAAPDARGFPQKRRSERSMPPSIPAPPIRMHRTLPTLPLLPGRSIPRFLAPLVRSLLLAPHLLQYQPPRAMQALLRSLGSSAAARRSFGLLRFQQLHSAISLLSAQIARNVIPSRCGAFSSLGLHGTLCVSALSFLLPPNAAPATLMSAQSSQVLPTGSPPRIPLRLATSSLCSASNACPPASRETATSHSVATPIPVPVPTSLFCSVSYGLLCYVCFRHKPAKSITCRLYAPCSPLFLFGV